MITRTGDGEPNARPAVALAYGGRAAAGEPPAAARPSRQPIATSAYIRAITSSMAGSRTDRSTKG